MTGLYHGEADVDGFTPLRTVEFPFNACGC